MNRNPYLRNIVGCIRDKSLSIPKMDSVTIKITNECNLNCSMCGYARNLKNEQVKTSELGIGEWKKVIDELKDLGTTYISVLGGEPLMYPGLLEVLDYMKSKGIQKGITTNGVYLKQYAERLINVGLHRINVSLDAFPEIHDSIRGVEGTFSAAIEGVREIYRLREGKVTPEIIINIVISEDNQQHLEEYLHYLEQMPEIDRIFLVLGTFTTYSIGKDYEQQMKEVFQCKATSWKGFVDCLGKIDTKKITELCELISKGQFKKKITVFPPLHSNGEVEQYYINPEKNFKWLESCCWKPWFGVDIRADGAVVVCNDWPDYEIGNLQDESMAEIWNGEKIKKLRKYIADGNEFSICKRCPWRYLPSFFTADP